MITPEMEEKIKDKYYYDGFDLIKNSTGHAAGTDNGKGYKQITVMGRKIYVHRVVFFLYHGHWPADQIDHINRDNTDNRIENLRECSRPENHRNRANTRGRSLPRNVWLDKSTGKFIVGVTMFYKRIRIGTFASLEAAELAAKEAREKYYGEYA